MSERTEEAPDAGGFLESLVVHQDGGLKVVEGVDLPPKVAWLVLFLVHRGAQLEGEEARLVDFFYRRVFG